MIEKLSIKGFKSIRELDLSCRRVNVFIGEPNTGKTNILEALGLWCLASYRNLRKTMRVDTGADLFWDRNLEGTINVAVNKEELTLKHAGTNLLVRMTREDGSAFQSQFAVNLASGITGGLHAGDPIYYLFSPQAGNTTDFVARLEPPFGQNLSTLLYSSKQARITAGAFFSDTGFRINIEQGSYRLLLTKEHDDILISFPYQSSSETLQRMVFYQLALDTNCDTPLVFDEPEAHAFPPFTKRLAERIATDDRGNQFFLTTHSPYMLDSLLSKTPAANLNVVLCRMEGFETKAYPLNEAQMGKLMEWSMDAFFNFDRLLDSDA